MNFEILNSGIRLYKLLIHLPFAGFVCVWKTLEFLESNFKALKVLEISFWSLKVLDFLVNKIEK